jgi:hypothetical protein
MSGHLTTYYTALQTERESLDRRAAQSWTVANALPRTDRLRSLKTLVITLAVAIVGFGGTAATLAHGLPGLPDGVIAERAAETGSDETVPARPWDGRPW